MLLIETLVWSLIMLVLGFLLGFLSVYFYITQFQRKQKMYQFKELDSFDFKTGIDQEILNPPTGSDIDGTKAVDHFRTTTQKPE